MPALPGAQSTRPIPGEAASFAQEALCRKFPMHQFRMEKFQGHLLVQLDVACGKNLSEPTVTDVLFDQIAVRHEVADHSASIGRHHVREWVRVQVRQAR